jgi:hypothetical protein
MLHDFWYNVLTPGRLPSMFLLYCSPRRSPRFDPILGEMLEAAGGLARRLQTGAAPTGVGDLCGGALRY